MHIDNVSSRYPSERAVFGEPRETSAGRAGPKGCSWGRWVSGGMSFSVVEKTVDGSHSSEFIRSLAKSTIISAAMQKMGGAGDEPKGRRQRMFTQDLNTAMQAAEMWPDV